MTKVVIFNLYSSLLTAPCAGLEAAHPPANGHRRAHQPGDILNSGFVDGYGRQLYIYICIYIYIYMYIYICKWMFSWGEISAFEIRRRFIQCGIFPLPSKFGWLNIDWIICLDTDTIRYSWPLHKIINQAIGWFPSELGPWHGDEATTIALNDSGPWHARKGAGRRAKIGPAGGERWPATDRVGSMVGEIIFLH